MAIKILIVADDDALSEHLAGISEQDLRLEILERVPDSRSAIQLARELKPDIILCDQSVPDPEVAQVSRQIVAQGLRTRIIVIAGSSNHKQIVHMLMAGASGYLFGPPRGEELVQAIKTVMADRVCISPTCAENGVPEIPNGRKADRGGPAVPSLSKREREVLGLLADGLSTQKIAERLYISERTVETHRAHIAAKLDLHSVAERTKYAILHKMTSLDL